MKFKLEENKEDNQEKSTELKSFSYMAPQTMHTISETSESMSDFFSETFDAMREKTNSLDRILCRMENENLALNHAMKRTQIDIVQSFQPGSEYLQSVVDHIQEYLAKPKHFEFRQNTPTDKAEKTLKSRLDQAIKAATDTSPAPKPNPNGKKTKIPTVKIDMAYHKELSLAPIPLITMRLDLNESFVSFSDLWDLHYKRHEVVKHLLDHVELTGLVIKAGLDATMLRVAARSEVNDDDPIYIEKNSRQRELINNADETAMPLVLEKAKDDEWCQRVLSESEMRMFLNLSLFRKKWSLN